MASRTVKIEMKDEVIVARLAWDRFDGDDCFEDFRITIVAPGSESRVYEFGPCVVRAVKKMKQFLSDPNIPSVSGGFQHPDVRTYEWMRAGVNLKLALKFEGSHLEVEHVLKSPIVTIDEQPYSYAPRGYLRRSRHDRRRLHSETEVPSVPEEDRYRVGSFLP